MYELIKSKIFRPRQPSKTTLGKKSARFMVWHIYGWYWL